ncbi:7-cyano-7-deazaguanine synthase QueC [Noviherbaspirillum pedocola]|uniref:7-cyano-7-deazaguanine synthase n=1 Tax=Noviherbaspirillum pedocola TaxID=2801341 RepID=A0A934SW85_9BURK|nr:7-cyano-7-deazaguanine synthase QueC [Noviherbaspirillum pedocola]MBK4736535.1 7-cyano-7-deazaguanine synthase QueC [Noviherbaspirillum pedocola]
MTTTQDAKTKGALVLFSGGQDSTTCAAWALARYERVETIGFDYGQRHAVELEVRPQVLAALRGIAPQWDARLGEDHMIDLSLLGQISDTSLTRDMAIAMQENGLPNTFVPGRNLLFMMVAATLAYRRGLDVLVGGMCETDYSGYPDCRNDTMQSLEQSINLGMATDMRIETPLMWIDKAATWEMARELGGDALVEMIRVDTHTCYLGERGALHDWGHGCGQCPACDLRARGWRAFQARRAEAS